MVSAGIVPLMKPAETCRIWKYDPGTNLLFDRCKKSWQGLARNPEPARFKRQSGVVRERDAEKEPFLNSRMKLIDKRKLDSPRSDGRTKGQKVSTSHVDWPSRQRLLEHIELPICPGGFAWVWTSPSPSSGQPSPTKSSPPPHAGTRCWSPSANLWPW